MGKLAVLLELCQGLSSTEAKLVSDVWKWSLWRSDDLCSFRFGVLEPIRVSGITEPCCVAKHQTTFTALANVLETCLKNIKFRHYDHLIMNTSRNKTGTDIWEVHVHWRERVSLWRTVKIGYSQIFGFGGSEESLSLSGVKLLLLVVDPEWTDGWYSLLHGERSRLLLADEGLLYSSRHSLEGRSHQTMSEKL